MAEFSTHEQQEESESHGALYIKVWFALLVLTVLEYLYAKLLAGSMLVLVLGLMTMAGTKAALVGAYFMHVKWEGKWVYGMIIPAGCMACVLIFGLIPDIANAATKEPREESDESVMTAPLVPGDAPRFLVRG